MHKWKASVCGVLFLFYLRQAGEDGGAAGGATADRGEGVAEHQATLGQRAQVGCVDHRVVIHLRLKTCIISWKREKTRFLALTPRQKFVEKILEPGWIQTQEH